MRWQEWADKANPCFGLRRNKETPRDFYAGDIIWNAVYEQAEQDLKDAMDLAYLTGQRPADVLKASTTDLNHGFLMVGQGKTEKRLRIRLYDGDKETDLCLFINGLLDRRAQAGTRTSILVTNQSGLRMSYNMLRTVGTKPGRRLRSRQEAQETSSWPVPFGSSNSGISDRKPPAK